MDASAAQRTIANMVGRAGFRASQGGIRGAGAGAVIQDSPGGWGASAVPALVQTRAGAARCAISGPGERQSSGTPAHWGLQAGTGRSQLPLAESIPLGLRPAGQVHRAGGTRESGGDCSVGRGGGAAQHRRAARLPPGCRHHGLCAAWPPPAPAQLLSASLQWPPFHPGSSRTGAAPRRAPESMSRRLLRVQFNITKLQLIESEKQKIRREYERKEGTIEVKKKVGADAWVAGSGHAGSRPAGGAAAWVAGGAGLLQPPRGRSRSGPELGRHRSHAPALPANPQRQAPALCFLHCS